MKQNWNKYDLLKLSLVNNIGIKRALKVIEEFSNFEDFKLNSKDYYSLLGEDSNIFQLDDLNKKYEYQLKYIENNSKVNSNRNYNIVSYFDGNYPNLLKEITDPPLILFTWGELKQLNSNAAAIVGTRKNSLYGKLTTEKIAEFLTQNKISIISGLAYGIDTIAHNHTIKNNGHTIAVIASGLDKLSPSTSIKNAEDIVEKGGAIISTFEFGKLAKPQYFLLRNRIICGVSKITIVVESAAKGGSLWTARFANDYNRDVFAVPGNINSEKSIGTNKLIKDNLAIMLNNVEDLLEVFELKTSPQTQMQTEISFQNPKWNQIYAQLSYEPVQIDELLNNIEIDMPMLLVNLLEMEFEGVIRQLPGKYYIKA